MRIEIKMGLWMRPSALGQDKSCKIIQAKILPDLREDKGPIGIKVKEMLSELRATGMPLPDDLVKFDRELTKRVEGAG